MMEIEKPRITCEETEGGSYARFIVEPLERGYGITLGNCMRRTLLGALPGAAPIAIRINGVLHEFSTVHGISEDVVDIVLNIKCLAVKTTDKSTDFTTTIHLRHKGEGVGAQILEASRLQHARVRYENVDAAEMLHGRIDQPFAIFRSGYVGGAPCGAASLLLYAAAQGLEFVGVSRAQNNLGPHRGVDLRHCLAYSRRGSRDDHGLILQSVFHILFVVLFYRLSSTSRIVTCRCRRFGYLERKGVVREMHPLGKMLRGLGI